MDGSIINLLVRKPTFILTLRKPTGASGERVISISVHLRFMPAATWDVAEGLLVDVNAEAACRAYKVAHSVHADLAGLRFKLSAAFYASARAVDVLYMSASGTFYSESSVHNYAPLFLVFSGQGLVVSLEFGEWSFDAPVA